jgi:hypothetical protein
LEIFLFIIYPQHPPSTSLGQVLKGAITAVGCQPPRAVMLSLSKHCGVGVLPQCPRLNHWLEIASFSFLVLAMTW